MFKLLDYLVLTAAIVIHSVAVKIYCYALIMVFIFKGIPALVNFVVKTAPANFHCALGYYHLCVRYIYAPFLQHCDILYFDFLVTFSCVGLMLSVVSNGYVTGRTDSFPLVMVGGVLEANKKWDIGREVVKLVSKEYPGAIPIRPKVSIPLPFVQICVFFLSTK